MPADTRALTRAARERMRFTGENYTAAHTALLAERAAADTPAPESATARITAEGELVLAPEPDTGFDDWTRTISMPLIGADHSMADRLLAEARWFRTVEWGAVGLTAGAEAAVRRAESVEHARAVREATYTPAAVDAPCRCSTLGLTGKSCSHGSDCESAPPGERDCQGRIVHVDRYPGSLWGLTTWEDRYICDGCREESYAWGDLDGLPWGYLNPLDKGGAATVVFDGVQHPGFGGGPDDGCGECGASTGYACHCFQRCPECGADGDAYSCDCD